MAGKGKRGPAKGTKVTYGNVGKGRPKNSPNKSTARAREAIAAFVDANTEKLQAWLDQIAETDGPKAAFQCLVDVLEYHVPKLGRTELTGKDGGAVVIAATPEDERL